MAKMYSFVDEFDERGGFGSDDKMLEKAFKEGCEHGYKKALRELEGYGERGGRMSGGRTGYREGFEEKLERLKEKYK